MNENIEITLAFLNYNTADDLLKALASVEEAIAGVSARIVVIDNGSTDDSVARIKSFGKEIEIIALPNNAGFAAAFNRIFSYVITPYYLLLNSDIILKPGCVKKMLDEFKAFPNAGLAGVALERENGSLQSSYGVYPNLASELINRSLWQKLKRRTDISTSSISTSSISTSSISTSSMTGGRETDISTSSISTCSISTSSMTGGRETDISTSSISTSSMTGGRETDISTSFTIGFIKKTRLRTVLYAGLLVWYFSGCPSSKGLGNQ